MDPQQPTSPPPTTSAAAPPTASTLTMRRGGGVEERPRVLVFIDPRGAFASVKKNPLAAAIFGVILAFSLLPPIAFESKADLNVVVQREVKKSGKLDQLPPDQKQTALDGLGKVAGFMKVALPVGAVAKRGMWIAVIALLCFGLMRGARPELRFVPVLAACALAAAPLAVHDVLVAATFLAKDVMALDAQNPVLSNPAAWLGLETGHSVAAAALMKLDFFELWACVLVGIGVNTVAGARSSVPYAIAFGGQTLAMILGIIGAAAAG